MKFEKRGDVTPEEKEHLEELEHQEQENQQQDKGGSGKSLKRREKSVLIYTALLFIVALGLVLLSYMVQQRRAEDQISDLTEQHSQFSIQALENIEELQNTNLELQSQLEEAQDQLEELSEESSQQIGELEAEIEELRQQYQELTEDYQALDLYVKLQSSVEAGDTAAALEQAGALENLKEHLTAQQRARLEEIQSQLGQEAQAVTE